jgi:hypothetical protein
MLNEDTQDDMEAVTENADDAVYAEANDSIRRYADAISRTLKK